MKVIDAYTGQEVLVGQTIPTPGGGTMTLVDIDVGLFSASATADFKEGARVTRRIFPLQVRWTHPRFFLQHVAFIPS